MQGVWIVVGVAGVVLLLLIALLVICFRLVFYSPKRKLPDPDEFPLPDGDIYLPYRDVMVAWTKKMRAMPQETVHITSYDGLTLHGKLFTFTPDAPIELMFHGYRGMAERDLCGGVQRCFALGHSALIVDHRASGTSDGHVITFGVREHRDCLSWVEYMVHRFGPEVKILLTGISMGAATVMMAAGCPLPPQVKGVLADCGYSSGPDIIRKIMRQMGLPCSVAYPLVRLSGRLFGGFDIEDAQPAAALERCRIPVLLFHGEADNFVPCAMSVEAYRRCAAPKKLVTVPNADHGLSYPADPEAYLQAIREFWTQQGVYAHQ